MAGKVERDKKLEEYENENYYFLWRALHFNTRYSCLVNHPITNVTEQGLTLLKRRNMLLSLWYSDSALKAFFLFLRWEKV